MTPQRVFGCIIVAVSLFLMLLAGNMLAHQNPLALLTFVYGWVVAGIGVYVLTKL